MTTQATTFATTPAFVLDPTLPWLFSDSTMQQPSAFRDMETVTLGSNYEPMGLYFPNGTQLAMRRVTSLDQLTEGAAYWSEQSHYEESLKKVVTRYAFGRYIGLAYPTSKSATRRWKTGRAHITLEADVLDCDLAKQYLRADGTETVCVDVRDEKFKLYQITHYVSLPAPSLAQLGPEAVKESGLTLKQACWLRQEKELVDKAVEFTAQTAWGGLDMGELRVVVAAEKARDFLLLQESLPCLTASQAKRRAKAGAIAITYRNRNRDGVGFTCTDYYKMEDAALLFDWLRLHSEMQHLQLEAAIRQQMVTQKAEAIREERLAIAQLIEAEHALKQAEQAARAIQERGNAPRLVQHHYAELADLALAA